MTAEEIKKKEIESLICKDEGEEILWHTGVSIYGDKVLIANSYCALLFSDNPTYPFLYIPRNIAVLTREKIRDLLRPESREVYKEYKVVCPECDGNEVVTASYTSFYKSECGSQNFTFDVDCPICGGSGKVTKRKRFKGKVVNDDINATINGGRVKYPFRYLQLIEPLMDILGVKEVKIEALGMLLVARLADNIRFFVLGDHYKLGDDLMFNLRLNKE